MPLRITGLASGLDIESMVSKLMKAERMPVDKLKQQRQILEWQRDGYREMNTALVNFRNTLFNMKLQSTYLSKKASSDSESSISVTASPNSVDGNYKVSVTQLATTSSITSSSVLGANDSSKTFDTIGTKLTSDTTMVIRGEKGTTTIDVKTSDTLAGFVSKVNAKSSITGVQAMYDSTLDKVFFTSTSTGQNTRIDLQSQDSNFLSGVLKVATGATFTAGKVTGTTTGFSSTSAVINSNITSGTTEKLQISYGSATPLTFDITNTTTVGQLLDKINSSDLAKINGISASFDSSTKQIVFVNPDTNQQLSFSDVTSDSFDVAADLGLPSSPTSGTAVTYFSSSTRDSTITDPNVKAGVNALVTFEGVSGSYASNTFIINGLTFTAKNLVTDANISVSKDVDDVFKSIKSFVDQYNDLLDKVNTKISEKRYRDYAPLTDDQKKDMKENDIKLWEERAKSGLLHGDSILSSGLNNFRRALYDPLAGLALGDIGQLTDIGITTGSYKDQGKLFIDESKLRDALANKPDQVMRLFTANDGDDTTSLGDGLAKRLYDKVNNVMKQITDRAGSTLSFSSLDKSTIAKNISYVDQRIDTLNKRLVDVENRYYKQFTAMEKALSQMNSQSSWLASQLGQNQS